MNDPWNILGWLLVWLIVIPVVATVARLAYEIVKDLWDDHLRRRAHKGKARCGAKGCQERATRTTPAGFRCEAHLHDGSRFSSVFYAFKLDYLNQEKK